MSEKRANNDWQYGKDDKNWVYGLRWGADPVFMPRQWAENVEAFASALSVETWGELKSELTPEAYADMITLLYEDDEEPSPETSIEIDSVYSYDDGELLPWVNQYMPDWMPDEILESFGVQGRSMVSGPGLFFDLDEVPAIVKKLNELGYTCVEDQSLVDGVCGT